MSTEHVKNELIPDFSKYISILNQLPLHPKNKLKGHFKIYLQQNKMAILYLQAFRNMGCTKFGLHH